MATKAPNARQTHAARRRPRVTDAKIRFISVRCTVEQHAIIGQAAAQVGLSTGAYIRAQALGKPGPRSVRRPPIERRELARLLGHLGKVGSNVNQLAHGYNLDRRLPGEAELMAIRQEVAVMRAALMKALGRDGH